MRDVLAEIGEVLVSSHARGGPIPEVVPEGADLVLTDEVRWRNAVPRQRVFQLGFAHVGSVTQGRQRDVGRHSLELGGGAARAVKLPNRDFERARVNGVRDMVLVHQRRQWNNGLHGALSKS